MSFANMKLSHPLTFFTIFVVLFEMLVALSLPSHASSDISLLKKSIITYNLAHLQKSLSDGSYRGEEGVLRIGPEVGRSFGLKVLMDRDYLEAKGLFEKADELFEKAVDAMTAPEAKRFHGRKAHIIAESALGSRRALQSAREKLLAYRSKLLSETDERLDKGISSSLLERLLEESLSRASCNLRDALGYFYNQCQGIDEDNPPLTPENVRFVNYVFNEFTEKTPETALNLFRVERYNGKGGMNPEPTWKHTLGRDAARYTSFIQTALETHKNARYPVDPLLFVALMRQESDFDPHSVSSVGAVGLTQIMPDTAKHLGMKNIFVPPYFPEASSFLKRERRLKARAMALIADITEENKLKLAQQARALMQESLDCKRQGKQLYARYKRALLRKGTDDRLDPRKSIEYGLKYFAQMMSIQKGDISLALASYNAGPHRIKQYKGIPPFSETVSFRNRILAYYRDYLRRLNRTQGGCQPAR